MLPRLFDFLKKQKPLSTVKMNRVYNNSRYNLTTKEMEDHSILSKSLDGNQLKKMANSYKLTPYWSIYQNMFAKIPAVSSAINKKKDAIISSDWQFKDINGYYNQELTDYINKEFNLINIISKASLQYDLYGTVIYTHYTSSDDKIPKPIFKLIPAGETRNYTVDLYSGEVTSLSWETNDVFNFSKIDLFDLQGNRNFWIGKIEDVDDQFLGQPLLRSLYTELDGKLQDDENYQLFLRNASFPGIIAMVSGDAEQITIDELNNFLSSLRDKEQRFKGSVVTNSTDSEGNPMIQFQTIKQAIENRLSLDEKKEINGQVYDCLLIPRKLMGLSTSGMGANEYETAMLDYKLNCIKPRTTQITQDLNNFVLPIIMTYLEDSGYFRKKQFKIKIDNTEKLATKDDFQFFFNEMEVETNSQKRESYLRGYELGIFTVSEVKEKAFDYKTKDLLDDDNFRKFKNNDYIVKEGELKSGSFTSAGGSSELANISTQDQGQDIAEEQTESSEEQELVNNVNNTVNSNFIKSLDKSIEIADLKVRNSGKVKKVINNFYTKADEYSKIPDLLITSKAKDQAGEIINSLKKQYGDINIDVIIDWIEKNGLDLREPESKDRILTFINLKLNKIENYFDIDNLVETMLFVARLGTAGVENNLNTKLNDSQKKTIQKEINSYSKERVKNLLGYKPEKIPEYEDEIFNPYFDGSLDITSNNVITNIIQSVLINYPTLSKDKQIQMIKENLNLNAEERGNQINQDNLSKAFGLAGFLASKILGARKKTWLRTKALNPRDTHLKMVGETVDFNKPFSNGSKWTQEEINCQCSIKVSFE